MILPLSEASPEVLAALARLMTETWPDWYGPNGPGDAAQDLARRAGPEGLPSGLVAVKDGWPVGTVALDAASHGAAPGEGPWLTGLVVAVSARGQGVASALIAATEALSRARGAAAIYCTTATAAGLLDRQGWARLRETPDGYRVYVRDLT